MGLWILGVFCDPVVWIFGNGIFYGPCLFSALRGYLHLDILLYFVTRGKDVLLSEISRTVADAC